MKNFKIKNSGFSLAEIMVALGIMGVVGLGVVNLTKVGGDQNKAMRQNGSIENAIGRISRTLSQAGACNAFGPVIDVNEVRAIAGDLEGGVTIQNVVQQNDPNPGGLALGVSETQVVKVQLIITFQKSFEGGRVSTLNRIAYARHLYENPEDPLAPGVGVGTQFRGCANYESDSSRAAFEANCRTLGATFRLSDTPVNPWDGVANAGGRNYWCDVSTINGGTYFSDKVKKEVCELLFGGVGSYTEGVNRCRDMIVNGTMTGANVDNTRIGLSDGGAGYNFRTTFDQNACKATPNTFVTGVNIDGTVNCTTIDWCVQGTAGCGVWTDGTAVDHCTTDCGCANITQADATENDFGDADGDGGVNTCRPTLSGLCNTTGTEEGGGQYDEGDGSDYLTYKCYGLDCDFKDYFEVTSGTVATDNEYDRTLSIGLYSTPDLLNANQTTSCGTPALQASETAGLCAIFDATSLGNLANYPQGNDTVPDSNGLAIALVQSKSYGTNKDYCNGSIGVCRDGGSGASGSGVAASEGSCCSTQFNDQPGSGDQCGNPMEDDCGNTYNNELGVVQQRWSVQCTSNGADGTQKFCEINGVARGNSGFTTINPSSSSTCCQQNYSCGTNPSAYSACQSAGSTFNYCSDGSLTCSREDAAGRCCKASYSCDETPDAECTGYHGAPHNICSGGTPQCLGSGPSATCVECINNTHCAANEYCSGNSCNADVCTQGVQVDTETNSCTPTDAVAGCDTANGESAVANSGSQSRSRTCNSEGSDYGSFGSWSSCSGGSCACLAAPLDPNTIACGTTDSNCAGTVNGTQCSAGFTCNAGTCQSALNWSFVKACNSDPSCTGGNCMDPASCFGTYLEIPSVFAPCGFAGLTGRVTTGTSFAIYRCQ